MTYGIVLIANRESGEVRELETGENEGPLYILGAYDTGFIAVDLYTRSAVRVDGETLAGTTAPEGGNCTGIS